jgi:hypothetical protein
MLVEGHGQLAGFFKKDLPAGHSGTGRLNLKWSERGIHCCFLLNFVRIFLKCQLIKMAGFADNASILTYLLFCVNADTGKNLHDLFKKADHNI